MSTDSDLGANLEELYKAGNSEIPDIADAFASAASKFRMLSFGPSLQRDSSLGTGPTGCSSELAALAASLREAASGASTTMTTVAHNLLVTAQDLARTDADIKAAFLKAGGRL